MVRVSVEPAHVEVGLGSAVSIEVRVFNASEIVDHFAVSALGVDPTWVSVDVDRAQLEPGAEGTVRVSIAVPESAQLPAGEHVVGIRVASLSNPSESAVEEIRLDVGAETDVSVQLEPSQLRSRRSARTNLRVDNRGNRPVDIEFSGTDPEMAVQFTFVPDRLQVPAFSSQLAVLTARVPRRWVGQPVTRAFTVTGSHEEGAAAASGSLVQSAVFASWLVRSITSVAALALVAVIAIVASGGLGGDSSASDEVGTTAPTTQPVATADTTPETSGDDSATTTPPTVAPVVQVADLVGLTVAEAQAWADAQGLVLSVSAEFVDVPADSGLAGRIATQSLPADAATDAGGLLEVALGVVRVVQTPDVVGLDQGQALQALLEVGLAGRVDGSVTVNLFSDLRGVVAEQAPAAGTEVEQGSVVSLLIGQTEVTIAPYIPLLARYPLTGDGVDATGNNGEMTLTNVTFAEGGVYCHGVHRNMDPGGCEILTPILAGFDFNRFSVHLEFRPTRMQDGPVVVGGTSYRWIGFLLNEDGTTTLLYNNSGRQQCDTSIRYRSNEWHGAALTYDGVTAQLFLDGALACEVAFDIEHSDDANFGTGNYSSGKVFEGWVRGLLVYNDVVAGGVG